MTLCELVSMWVHLVLGLRCTLREARTPTAGEQYHCTWELSPPRYRKFLTDITGWQLVLAWQVDLASAVYLGGNIIQALILLSHPAFHAVLSLVVAS